MHPVLLALPLPDDPLPMLPALVAASLLGLALLVYGHVLRRTGLRTFGVALGLIAGAAAWSFRAETITLGVLRIPAYGTALGLAVVAGWWITVKRAERVPNLTQSVRDTLVVCAVCGLLAGRASFVLISADQLPELEVLDFRQGGLLGMGALLGGLLAAYAFLKHLGQSIWGWLDAVAPGFAFGVVLVRVGCWLNGCDYGTRLHHATPKWSLPLLRFERWQDPSQGPVDGPAAWIDQVVSGALSPEQTFTHAVHPVQLYEAVGGLCLLLLVRLLSRWKLAQGQLGLSVVFGYAALRFVLEVFRGDAGRGLLGPLLQPAVLLGIGLLLFAAAFAYGPSTSLARGRVRVIALVCSVLPAGIAALAVGRAATPIQPSISHWLALGLAGWAAHAWTITSKKHPSVVPS